MNRKLDIAQKFKATVLVLILLAPMLVQGLHRHEKEHCCTIDSPVGLNPFSTHHSVKSCLICNFEYVNVLPEDPHGLQVFLSEIRDISLPFNEPGSSVSLIFTSSRAPPLSV